MASEKSRLLAGVQEKSEETLGPKDGVSWELGGNQALAEN